MADSFPFQCQPFQLFDDHSSVFLHNTQFMSSALPVEEQDMFIVNVGDHVHVSHKQRSQETLSSVVVDTRTTNRTCNDENMVKQIYLSDNKRKNSAFSSLNSIQSKENGRGKGKKQKKRNIAKGEENKKEEEKKKEPRKEVGGKEESPTGYIHVRARRGQATDSHSLAERVRREKISERMKALQRLVPGCDKITGKTHVLDEIINYVQSLQNQVKTLTLKLDAVNSFFYDSSGMDDVTPLMMHQESLSSLTSSAVVPLQLKDCIPSQPTTFADSINSLFTTSNAPINAFSLLDTSSASNLLLHQDPHDHVTPVSNGDKSTHQFQDLLWDLGEQQSQNFLNPNGLDSICLPSIKQSISSNHTP